MIPSMACSCGIVRWTRVGRKDGGRMYEWLTRKLFVDQYGFS